MKTSIGELPLQRPTWAEVNLDLLRSNFQKVRQIAPNSRILAVVKSDAYGHGAVLVAKELEAAGASFFGVATAAEALALRESGVKTPILVLSGMTPEQLPLLLRFDMMPAVFNREVLDALIAFASKHQHKVKVHLKVNTGMGRLGLTAEEAAEVLKAKSSFVEVEGLFTHFACADWQNDEGTLQQLHAFQDFLKTHRNSFPFTHSANSAAILNYPESHMDVVRPGLLLYGISPISRQSDWQAVLSLKSRIIYLNRLPKGETIGYGRTFRAERDSLIATVPFGYADGLRRRLSNQLKVQVCAQMCPIAGTISMDLCMVDVTDVADRVQLYDEVAFLGPRTTAWDWADLLGTIPYEITCLIGARVPRVYFKNNEIYDVYYP